jgi:xylulose-5-phosphate/fructose-6-phosphate phosphoketolase
LAIDAIDRIPRFRETGSNVGETLLNLHIFYKNYAYEFGVDPKEITGLVWPTLVPQFVLRVGYLVDRL